MNAGNMYKLSDSNIYVSRDYRGKIVIIKDEPRMDKAPSGIHRTTFLCMVVENSQILPFFDYQLSDARLLAE